jgi:hypothetical protein
MAKKISLNSIITQNNNSIIKEFGSELIVFNPSFGHFYEFNEVATFILKKIKKSIKVKDLLDLVISEYEVGEEKAKKDLVNFLEDCMKDKIIKIKDFKIG